MKVLKKIGLAILDFVEVGMPVVALTIVFVSFIVNVISRYVVHSPVNACYELCLTGLLWCLLLSAPYAVRKHNNVAFTLIYDRLNAVGQLILRMGGNLFLIFCFGAMLYPCYDWVRFMQRKYTAVLKIRMDIIYSPFVVFNVLVLAHLIYDVVIDVIHIANAARGIAPLPGGAVHEEIEAEESKEEGGGV